MKLLKRIQKFFGSFFQKKPAPGYIITEQVFAHVVYVNAKGILCLRAKSFTVEIVRMGEWPDETKEAHKINLSTTVVDILFIPCSTF